MAAKDYLVPDYIIKFKCQMCGECCRGWKIPIDDATMKYYQELAENDHDFSILLSESLKKAKSGGAYIQLKHRVKHELLESGEKEQENVTIERNVCPFLDDDKLCFIQKKFGLEALSDTCKKFPRIVFLTERGLEMGLTYACAAAAQTLKDKNTIQFYHNPEGFTYPPLKGGYDKIGDFLGRRNAGKTAYFEVEEMLIGIMQHRGLSLDIRLLLSGIIVDKLKDGNIDGIRLYLNNLDGNLIKQLENLPSQPGFMMKLVKEAVDKRLLQGSVVEQDMARLLALAYRKLNILDGAAISSEQMQIILQGYDTYYKPYIDDISHIYENYFVNFIFSKKFFTHKYMDAYFLMVFFYTIIRFFSICICIAEQRNVDEDIVVAVIRAVERSIGHNASYYEDVLRQIKHGDYRRLPHIISLINLKNHE